MRLRSTLYPTSYPTSLYPTFPSPTSPTGALGLGSVAGLIGLMILIILIGCGADPEQLKDEAQQALSVGDFARASELSERALQNVPGSEKRLTWALERIRLEALARDNRGQEVRETLERLAVAYPAQTNASLYLAVATYLKDAGGVGDAIEVLAAGDERFPEESEKFKAMIGEMEAGGLDPADIERLKSLGYL